MENARCDTIRTKLLKIGANVTVTVRKVWLAMASACPYQDLFARVWKRLQEWNSPTTETIALAPSPPQLIPQTG